MGRDLLLVAFAVTTGALAAKVFWPTYVVAEVEEESEQSVRLDVHTQLAEEPEVEPYYTDDEEEDRQQRWHGMGFGFTA